MHGWKRLATVGLVTVAALAASMAPASASSGTTRWVDGDGHASRGDCNGSGHAFTSIQAAVDASGRHDTVIVCPGAYREQVTIEGDRDGLTLRSSRSFGATIRTPSVLATPYGFSYLVLVNHVDDVTVAGFKTIVRTAAPCTTVQGTIVVMGARRAAIRGNRLLAPGSGVSAACYQQDGIVVIDGAGFSSPRTSSATIGFNEVRDAIYLGVAAQGIGKDVNVDIVHDSIRAYFGHAPAGGSSITSAPTFAGVAVELIGRVRGSIRSNVIQSAFDTPTTDLKFLAGIVIEADPSFPNRSIHIHDNIVRRVYYGLVAVGARRLTIDHNALTSTSSGVEFEGVTLSTFEHNTVGARSGGIQVDASSSGDTFRFDAVSGAGGYCKDESTGGGTAGTANTWSGNTATVASTPAAICTLVP